jgi:hypothetical protein
MPTVRLDGTLIRDEASFHEECQRVLGFLSSYGANWNAWIDCLSYVDDPAAEMSTVHVPEGQRLDLEITAATDLGNRCPGLLRDLVACTAAVNQGFVRGGSEIRVALIFLEEGPG